jgi:hypothetical protein
VAEKEIFGALSVRTVEEREPAPEERGGEDVPKLVEFVKKRNMDCGTGFGTFARAEKPRFQERRGKCTEKGRLWDSR